MTSLVLIWLALAIGLMVFLTAIRLPLSLCILAGLVLFGLLALGPEGFASCLWSGLVDLELWDMVASVALIAVLGAMMRELGQVDDITGGLRALGLEGKSLIAVASATFGLLPIPGGAILSASLVEEEGRSHGMDARGPATANLLFRHFNFFAYPLSPALILLASPRMLNVSLYLLIAALLPAALAHLAASYVASFCCLPQAGPGGRREPKAPASKGGAFLKLMRGLAPILVAPVLNALGLSLTPAVCGSLLASLLLAHGKGRGVLAGAARGLRKSKAHSLAVPVLFALLFRDAFKASGASEALRALLSGVPLPEVLALTLLCLALGLMTGSAMLSITVLPSGLSLAEVLPIYTGAVVGYVISPLHLCFIVSAEYFGLGQAEMYPRLAVYAVLTSGASLLAAWALMPFLG